MNADDLGYDPEIDRGILEAHGRGVVTSATAMVDTRFAPAALRAAPTTLGLGLHAVLDPASSQAEAEAELLRQIARFTELRGALPTHLDSHKHHHARPALLAAFTSVARAQRFPVRALDAQMRALLRASGVRTTDHFVGDADLRPCWTPERLLTAVGALAPGTTELMCHPGYSPSHARTSFGAEREVEMRAVCDPAIRQELQHACVALVTFGDI